MGKRTYYIVEATIDYDGYDSWVDYFGDQPKELFSRINYSLKSIKDDYFAGYGEDEIYEGHSRISLDDWLISEDATPYNYYINNDDNIWINLYIYKVNKNQFANKNKENAYLSSKQ